MSLRGDGAALHRPDVTPTVVLNRATFDNLNSAMNRLFEVFPDQYPTLVLESEKEWTFELGWPRHILEPVDPSLPERARSCFDVGLPDLGAYLETRWLGTVPFVFSMFHSWAILAPALAAQHAGSMPTAIVHVDAHHDLSPSLLRATSTGVLRNDHFNMQCRLDAPDSVDRSIGAGFINKASFLTAYLLGLGGGQLIHVEPGLPNEDFILRPNIASVTIGGAETVEEGFTFMRSGIDSDWHLAERAALPESIDRARQQRVWLDVDLDAFSNRFDGDSDNRERTGSRGEREEALRRVKVFLAELRGSDWLSDISAVSVAASPGFFPSEYWDPIIPITCDGIANLL
ncbi:MAG: hypothetical protein JNK76_03605 [Planctomycetales bacterium]|nr:hypothetical protein [Planctomycetales bacterium]MBN8628672.1 hypothetical protein [Planctomycetota bacterium]